MISKEALITENLRLAPYCVRRFLSRYRIPPVLGLDTEDLVSEAFLALCRAADMWDPARGAFSTYAVVAINNWLINVCKLDRASIRTEIEMISLDTPVGESEEERLMDLLPDQARDLEEVVMSRSLADDLRAAVRELPERDRAVMTALIQGETPSELARAYGCSRQRIEQIQSRAFRRLKNRLVHLDPNERAGEEIEPVPAPPLRRATRRRAAPPSA
jgi:RNA polymerase sigma factor (sigma-70 family)